MFNKINSITNKKTKQMWTTSNLVDTSLQIKDGYLSFQEFMMHPPCQWVDGVTQEKYPDIRTDLHSYLSWTWQDTRCRL